MIIYLVKSTILLALLLGVYKLFLENEKMHTFNRFFLLAALVLGLTAPLVEVSISPNTTIAGVEISKVESTVNAPSDFVAKSIEPIISDAPAPASSSEIEGVASIQIQSEKPLFSKQQILLLIYGLITLFFLIRFGAGLFELFSKVRLGVKSSFKSSTLVLLEEKITPQSFLKWIFLNKSDFESDKINPEILEHELTHIRQKHSLDVLFIELIKTAFWFNPVLYYYKHAIQLNHEFLADDSVLSVGTNAKSYQKILISACSTDQGTVTMTSKFNLSNTKKRVFMISNKTTRQRKITTLTMLIPVLTFSFLWTSTNVSSKVQAVSTPETSQPSQERASSFYVQAHTQIEGIDPTENIKPSHFVSDFSERLNTYNTIEQGFINGSKTDRDLLYQRIRLVWLHQRLTPSEQKLYVVPKIPENLIKNVKLTEQELLFEKQLSEYHTLRKSYEELPKNKDDVLYTSYDALKTQYESLPLSSQKFIIGNLPSNLALQYMPIEMELKTGRKHPSPFEFNLAKEDKHLAIHYIDANGNVVSTTIGELSVTEKKYLVENTSKSFVTQVYPIPLERNPTKEEMEQWQDSSTYKILLDGEIIQNNELVHINPSNIHHAESYEVRWNANRRLPFDFEIQLYTYKAFDEMAEKYRPSQGMAPFHSAILID
tara:strand:+ start:78012 stop:79982 length:1971 start_codon:yes stop_codon:yes gene_type:complete